MAELGRRINLCGRSRERIQRLEGAGVITGYRAEVDPKAIGFPIAAVVNPADDAAAAEDPGARS